MTKKNNGRQDHVNYLSNQKRPAETVGKTADELIRLLFETGNSVYRDGVYFECDRMVLKWLHLLKRSFPELHDDLYQAGEMGIGQAIEKFDGSGKAKFSSFAFPYIKGSVFSELNLNNLFGACSAGRAIAAVKKAAEQVAQEGKPVTLEEVKQRLKENGTHFDIEASIRFLESSVTSCSLETPSTKQKNEFRQIELNEAVHYCLEKIDSPRDRMIAWRHIGYEETVPDLAREYHLSEQRINAICAKAKTTFRQAYLAL